MKPLASKLVIAAALSMLAAGSAAADRRHHGGHGGRGHPESRGTHSQGSRDHDRSRSRRDRHYRPRFYGHRGFHRYDGFRGNFGFYFGSPFYADPYYWNRYPYPPPTYYVPQQPRIYIQQNQQQPYYWYWCANPPGYYPYIKSCPQPWQKVVPYGTPPR